MKNIEYRGFGDLCRSLAFLSVVALAAAPARCDNVAAPAPQINTTPGPEYADEGRMFQGIPAIARSPSGRLWASWYGGGVGEDRHNYIMLATSDDDGAHWSDVKLVLDPDRDGPWRAFDPCLWHDPQGRMWLFWSERDGEHPNALWAIVADDSDSANPQWSKPRWIAKGIMMNKPIVTCDGAWLLPVANWKREGSSEVVKSTDQGATWSVLGSATIPNADDRDCDEQMFVERLDGSLLMWVRTKYGIGQSISIDGGKTWPDVQPANIAHERSRFFIRRLSSGRLLLVKHGGLDEQKPGRTKLMAYLSDDDARSWYGGLLLDDRDKVSYPDGDQAPDGTIYVVYDRQRTRDKEILMAKFTERDIVTGGCKSPDDQLQILVNKATGKRPAASE